MMSAGTRLSKDFRFLYSGFVVLLGLVALIGCGGGGGGGSVASGPAPITYVGNRSPASISAANATVLATESLMGAQTGSVFSLGMGSETPSTEADAALFVYRFPTILQDVAETIDFSEQTVGAALIDLPIDPIDGPCGGRVNPTLSVEDTTGAFSGTFVFNQYCDGEMIISGSVAVDGSISLPVDTGEIQFIHFNFINVSSGDITLSGDVSTDVTGTPVIITMDFRVRDNVTGKVFWVNDYTLAITETNPPEIEVDITGTYFNPDYGYITICDTRYRSISDKRYVVALALRWHHHIRRGGQYQCPTHRHRSVLVQCHSGY